MPGSSLNGVHDASQAPALPASSRSGYTRIPVSEEDDVFLDPVTREPSRLSRTGFVNAIAEEVRSLTSAQINERRAERIAQTAANLAASRHRADEAIEAKRRKRA